VDVGESLRALINEMKRQQQGQQEEDLTVLESRSETWQISRSKRYFTMIRNGVVGYGIHPSSTTSHRDSK